VTSFEYALSLVAVFGGGYCRLLGVSQAASSKENLWKRDICSTTAILRQHQVSGFRRQGPLYLFDLETHSKVADIHAIVETKSKFC
jgi:hypothetical protein